MEIRELITFDVLLLDDIHLTAEETEFLEINPSHPMPLFCLVSS